MNYQLGDVIGKIGGTEVQITPVDVNTPSEGTYVLHTVDIPEGQTWLVSVVGEMHGHNLLTRDTEAPYLRIGKAPRSTLYRYVDGPVGLSMEATGTTRVELVKQGYVMDRFTGTVYATPLP